MLNYLKHSEISARLGLNPFNWLWIPSFAYDAPSVIYPKRRTYAVAWLGLQIYVDIDNGTQDLTPLQNLFSAVPPLDEIKETDG